MATRSPFDHPAPGYVRLLNLSSKSASLYDKTRRMCAASEPGAVGQFAAFGSGKRVLTIVSGANKLALPEELTPGENATLVLCADGNHVGIVAPDQRSISAEHNFNVGVVTSMGAQDSSWNAVEISDGVQSSKLTPHSTSCNLGLGSWHIKASGIISPPGFEVKKDYVYTLILVKEQGGAYAAKLLERNATSAPSVTKSSKA